jgi:hypothetical protein
MCNYRNICIIGRYKSFKVHFALIYFFGFEKCIRYSTIETKEFARIGYNGFLFPHEYSGEGRGA